MTNDSQVLPTKVEQGGLSDRQLAWRRFAVRFTFLK
jgi:hypothetical protein